MHELFSRLISHCCSDLELEKVVAGVERENMLQVFQNQQKQHPAQYPAHLDTAKRMMPDLSILLNAAHFRVFVCCLFNY